MSQGSGKINEHDIVALLRDLPEEGLETGRTGTAVFVHKEGETFEVEFPLGDFRYTVITVRREDLLKIKGLAPTRRETAQKFMSMKRAAEASRSS